MSHRSLILLLGFLIGIQPITTDLYLPVLPELTQVLGGTIAQAQLTLSALLLAFGCSQLLWGLLSDRFGRRPVLMFGLFFFALSAFLALLSNSMLTMVFVRVLQGIGMGAVVVCARAIVRDQFEPLAGARAMSKAFSILGLIACLCVPLGVLIRSQFGVFSVFWALAAYGLLLGGVVALKFDETLATGHRQAISMAGSLRIWLGIMRNPQFRTYCALSTASYCGLFAFLASSSFVFTRWLQLSLLAYGCVMMGASATYFLGTHLCRLILRHWGWRKAIALGGGLSVLGAGGVLLLAYSGVQSVWSVVLPYSFFMLGHGFHQPCGQSGCVAAFPQAAGASASVNGFFMMLFAFGTGLWLGGKMTMPSIFPMAHALMFWAMVIAAIAWYGVPKHDIKQ
jgi:MFS transporter, DHA1 family, multidrug resistance protein